MGTMTVEERRKAILEKQAKLKQELRLLQGAERAERRKLEARGLIVLGGLVKASLTEPRLAEFCQKATRPQDVEVLERLGWLRPRFENAPQA